MPPILVTPTAEVEGTCKECGTALVMTGKPATFSEGRKPREYRGWIPGLVLTICPTCDSRPGLVVDIDEDAPLALEQPATAVAAEGYLERLGREADERAAKEDDAE